MSVTDPLSATFSALADPTRRALLAQLTEGEASVNQLAEPFDMTLQAVSRHLKVLEAAGLVARSRNAQWRPCRLDPAPLREIDGWLARYRTYWLGSFDKMDAYLTEITRGDPDAPKN
ncbi:ArsR/SmtB family transcription factor [Devosia nitrariae]|uniref:Transcriptional regulator n=1 Tax=Devosia nitrariae TaxID=2071872 RepID=A0ABQ5VYJ8_9HYPH|nr:metalloregulator ArsR/SmtB family transcription factor [Devosia nitrariae]GLQ52797.1 transcriptional regulator [Devosia nitrariae]